MGISKGTKLTENPKNCTIKVRLDENDLEKLNFLAQKTKSSKSEILRKGIEIQYEQKK